MSKGKQIKKASASVTTVIALTAVLLIGGIAVLMTSMDLAKSTKGSLMASLTKLRARSCLEESLQEFKYDPTYTGTVNLTFEDGACSAVITNHPTISTNKLITIAANIDNYNFEESREVNVYSTPFNLID